MLKSTATTAFAAAFESGGRWLLAPFERGLLEDPAGGHGLKLQLERLASFEGGSRCCTEGPAGCEEPLDMNQNVLDL